MLPLLLALLLASPSVQNQKLDDAQARLEKLRSDARRRRYRDGWESVLRELAAAVKAAPKGARAAEASLAAARVRVQLFEVSRSPADARSALAALRKVDEDYPGPAGLQALHAAVQLSWHTKDPGDRAAAAKRLIERYPASDAAPTLAARTAALAGIAAPAPAAGSASAESKKPVSVGDDDESDDDEAAPEPEAPADPPSRSTPIVRAVKTAVAALTEPDDEQLTPAQSRELRTAALRSGPPPAPQLGLKVRGVAGDAGHGGRGTRAIRPHA